MRIIVKRGNGNIFAPHTADFLVNTIPVALQRGRIEMDPGAGLLPAEQESAYRATAQTGDLAESFDELSGTAWRGVSTSAEHSLGESGELVTRQTLLREPPK